MNNRLAILEDLLKLSLKMKDYKMNIRIYNNLGDHYLKDGIYEQAIGCYQSACENINKILSSVPEEFKTGILECCRFNEIFNKLAEVKQMKV
jgi:tetratricopeptide (TPR) repeat protein